MSSLFFILATLFWISPQADAQNVFCKTTPVRLVTTGYPPYQSENANDGGVVNKLVETALLAEGCKVEFVSLPWQRGFLETQNGQYDAILGIWHSPERERYFLYSVPLTQNQLAVIKRKGSKFVFDRKTVSQYTMGLVQNYAYPDTITRLPVLRIEYAPDDRLGLLMVSGGRVDFGVLDKAVVLYLLSGDLKSIHDKVEVGEVIAKAPLYLGISLRKDTARILAERLKSGLRKIEKNGDIKKVREFAKKNSVEILPSPKE
ncbi:substrate-binding periplasmic protein [Bdellovibrio sp. HCB337]|uniref:substrate-binding periplasmic protein n=1 Tax=Bdellovibrio sp. HCB337 TaxID=3394358 RepID=UPI0039A5B0CC